MILYPDAIVVSKPVDGIVNVLVDVRVRARNKIISFELYSFVTLTAIIWLDEVVIDEARMQRAFRTDHRPFLWGISSKGSGECVWHISVAVQNIFKTN